MRGTVILDDENTTRTETDGGISFDPSFPLAIQDNDSYESHAQDDGTYNQIPNQDPDTIVQWNFTNVPQGIRYELNQEGWAETDDAWCFITTYHLYVWDGTSWNERKIRGDWVETNWSYDLTQNEYRNGNPKVRVRAFCSMDEGTTTTLHEYTDFILIRVYDEDSIAIITPEDGRTIMGELDFKALVEVEGQTEIEQVSFILNSKYHIATHEGGGIWKYKMNTEMFADGYYTLTARANHTYGYVTDEILIKIVNEPTDCEEIEDGVVVCPIEPPRIPRTRDDFDGETIDPFRTMIYDMEDTYSGSSGSSYCPYDESESNVVVMRDWMWFSAVNDTQNVWINDTKSTVDTGDDTELINETGVSFYMASGQNVSIESNDTFRFYRFSEIRQTNQFNWTRDNQITTRYKMGDTITNNLQNAMLNVFVYWSKVPDTFIDPRSVVIIDTTNNMELTEGRHFAIDFTGISMEISSIGTSTTRQFKVWYEDYVEGSDIIEPVCTIYNYEQASKFGKQYELSQVTCTNDNPFAYSGKVIVHFALKDTVDLDSIIAEDIEGKKYETYRDLSQLVILKVEFEQYGSKTFNIWFKFSDDTTTERVVQDLIPWFIVLGAILIAIGLGGWLLTDYGKLAKEMILEKKRMYRLVFGVGAVIEILTAIGTIWA